MVILKVSSSFGSVVAEELKTVDLHALPMAGEEEKSIEEPTPKDITANSPESPF